MSGYVASGAPLVEVIGAVGSERENALRGKLVQLDASLRALAAEATSHVGDEFTHCSLQVHDRVSEISGGASADVGDVWFELWRAAPDRWEVSAAIPVHCDLMPRGYSCTHDL